MYRQRRVGGGTCRRTNGLEIIDCTGDAVYDTLKVVR